MVKSNSTIINISEKDFLTKLKTSFLDHLDKHQRKGFLEVYYMKDNDSLKTAYIDFSSRGEEWQESIDFCYKNMKSFSEFTRGIKNIVNELHQETEYKIEETFRKTDLHSMEYRRNYIFSNAIPEGNMSQKEVQQKAIKSQHEKF